MAKVTRAPKGGCVGINGSEYEGGQFLPSSPLTVKGMQPQSHRRASRKQEIANYVWEVPPTAGHISIYRQIAGTAARWDWDNKCFEVVSSDEILAYLGMSREQAQNLVNRWNAGERWMLKREAE